MKELEIVIKQLKNIDITAPKKIIQDLSSEFPKRNEILMKYMKTRKKLYFMYSYKNSFCYADGILVFEFRGYKDCFNPILSIEDLKIIDEISIIGTESHRKKDYEEIKKIINLYKK